MTEDQELRDLERRLSRSLHAAAPHPDPHLAERLLSRTAASPQRRRPGGLSLFGRALAVAAVALVAVAVGAGIAGLPRNVGAPEVTRSPDILVTTPPAATPTSSATPEPATPSPSPSPSGPLAGGATCTNEPLGYAVRYPSDWHTNERVEQEFADPVPACQYFAPQPFEVQPNAGLPDTVAIGFGVHDEAPPISGSLISSREVTVAGRPAIVREWAAEGGGPFIGDGDRVYEYLVELPDGGVLVAGTDTTRVPADYDGYRAVLDQMMDTLELTGDGA